MKRFLYELDLDASHDPSEAIAMMLYFHGYKLTHKSPGELRFKRGWLYFTVSAFNVHLQLTRVVVRYTIDKTMKMTIDFILPGCGRVLIKRDREVFEREAQAIRFAVEAVKHPLEPSS